MTGNELPVGVQEPRRIELSGILENVGVVVHAFDIVDDDCSLPYIVSLKFGITERPSTRENVVIVYTFP